MVFTSKNGSYATICLRNSVEIKDVADILGHSKIETTQNYYIFPTENTKKRAMLFLKKWLIKIL